MSSNSEETERDSSPHRGTSLSLLERLRTSDEDAWVRLVRIYSPLVRYWCGQFHVRPEDTEDVMQEVFQAASRGLAGFRRDRPGDSFRGWLRGITRHQALMEYRRAGRQPKGRGGTDALHQIQSISDGDTAEEDDPPAEVNGLYKRALELVRSEFESRTWLMFWATAVDGRAPADVAADMGVTPAAVRKAKSRVLHRLKEEVGDLIA